MQLTLRYSKRRLPKKLKQNSLNKLIESSSLAQDCIGGDAVKIKTNHLLIFLHNCFSKASVMVFVSCCIVVSCCCIVSLASVLLFVASVLVF